MAKCGPKPLKIDWKEFDALCAVQCTLAEIALHYDVSEDTIERAVQKQWQMRFADYYRQKRRKGFISLRHKQWQLAAQGNPTMLVWLGKQWLGQSDRHELTGADGGPIQYERVDLRRLSDAELAQLEELVEKAHAEVTGKGRDSG
jgi:DNA-binding MarR family transcriptional regulator